jgi:hypothetical protein
MRFFVGSAGIILLAGVQEPVVRSGRLALPIALLGCALLSPRASAQTPATQPDKFIRFVDRGSKGGELDTADVTFSNGHGVTVHLVAAVHVAEASYYQGLSDSFTGYDAVLYEMISPRGSAPPAGGGAGERSDSVISQLQVMIKDALDLDFQLDDIDYTKSNFVHADLDKETFEKMEADRGESLLTLMLQEAMKEWNSQQAGTTPDADDETRQLVDLLCRPDGRRQFKLMLARDMDQLEGDAAGLDGPGGSVILTERNKAAFKALTTAMAGGKKKIAIFFGAAHMPDMAARLKAMGFTPVGTDWRMAWDLTIRADEPSNIEWMINSLIDAAGSGGGN